MNSIEVKSLTASLGIHLIGLAVVIALDTLPLDAPAEFSGSSRIVQIETLSPGRFESHTSVSEVAIAIPLEIAAERQMDRQPLDEPIPVRLVDLKKRETRMDFADRGPIDPARAEKHSPIAETLDHRRQNLERTASIDSTPSKTIPRRATASAPVGSQVSIPVSIGTNENSRPDLASNQKPQYPQAAYQQGIQGEVLLRLYISATGKVERVEVERSSGYSILDQAAVIAVRTWHGKPARRNGQPTATVELLPIRFVL